jgi:uridine kinase
VPSRRDIWGRIADILGGIRPPHPLRVAIDGLDAAGKTTLADELAAELERRGRPVIRASVDGFHHPRARRYRRGPMSPDGYFLDSFDLAAIRREVLDPLGWGGSLRYRVAVFDYRADRPVEVPPQSAPSEAVLLFDGIFLLRPELDDAWDYRIFVEVSPETSGRRGTARDRTEERYRARYLPAQRWYLQTVDPMSRADLRVVNEDPFSPVLLPAGRALDGLLGGGDVSEGSIRN